MSCGRVGRVRTAGIQWIDTRNFAASYNTELSNAKGKSAALRNSCLEHWFLTGNLLEMQITMLHFPPNERETPGVSLSNLTFNKPFE